MANLGTWRINTKGQHVKLSEVEALNLQTKEVEQGISLSVGGTFLFNIENHCRLRAGELGLGVPIYSPNGFTYTDDQISDLYIQTTDLGCIVNISE